MPKIRDTFEPAGRESDSGIYTRLMVERHSRMERISTAAHDIGDLTGQLAKIGLVVSAIVGTALLTAYLHSVGAPFPSPDASIGAFLTLLTSVFVLFSIVAGTWILLPALTKVTAAADARKTYPELYSGKPFTRSFIAAYIRYFGAFLSMVVASFVSVLLRTLLPHVGNFEIMTAILVVVGFLAGLAWLFASVRRSYSKEQAWTTLFGAVSPTCLSFVWVCLPALTAAEVVGQKIPHLNNPSMLVVALLCFSLSVFFHFIISASQRVEHIVGLFILFLLLITMLYPGLPYLGGAGLRFLGIGGGAPVSILIKTMEPGSAQVAAKEVNGCLIFALGSDVLIAPMEHREECKVIPKIGCLWDRRTAPQPYDRLERYARSDVLKFSKFVSQDSR